jgi:hypothetical protein
MKHHLHKNSDTLKTGAAKFTEDVCKLNWACDRILFRERNLKPGGLDRKWLKGLLVAPYADGEWLC